MPSTPRSTSRGARRGIAALASAALVATGATLIAPAPGAAAAEAAPEAVSGAEFRWNLNNETQAAAYAPGTWNLFSAGKVGDPGAGGRTLTTADSGATWNNGAAAGWKASAGNVVIEDLQADGSYAPTTFQGTRTNSAGTPTTAFGSVLSENVAVFKNGTGTVDAETGAATISWDGDLSVLFYSGMTFFYLSDPVLTVDAEGDGVVKATVGGYGTSMEDMDEWAALPDREVTLATLTDVEVGAEGFTATPAYRGVEYTAPQGATAQTRTGDHWGAFPQDFVDFQQTTGQSTYWYSSGGSADPRKVANPLEVSWSSAPAVSVSDTTVLPDGSHEVTVEGVNFDPADIRATRPPLAPPMTNPASSGGVYVVFGKFAESWRPSQGAAGATRVNTSQKWAVLAKDVATVGGADAGAVELRPDGSFTATVTVDKAAIDAKVGENDALVNYGVYTYPGSGAVNAAYETYTPITFEQQSATVAVSTRAVRFGPAQAVNVAVRGADATPSGEVTVKAGSRTLGTATLDAAGRAGFVLPARTAVGTHPITASYAGDANTAAATGTGSIRIAKNTTTTGVSVTAPTSARNGRVDVKVTSPSGAAPSGKVTISYRDARNRVIRSVQANLVYGRSAVALPARPRGTYQVLVAYRGDAGHGAAATRTVRFAVR